MPGHLLALLRVEERQLLAELRASPSFQKLEAVRRVIALYASGGADDGQVAELLLGADGADHPPAAKDAPTAPDQAAVAESVASAPWHAAPAAAAMATPVEAPAPEPAAVPRVAAEAPRGAATILAAAAANAGGPAAAAPDALRDGSKAVSAVRAALLAAVTR